MATLADAQGRARRRWLAAAAAAVVVVVAAATVASVLLLRSPASSSQWQPVNGFALDKHVPNLPLRSSSGRSTSLAAYRGKVVVLTPFLSLCSEVCPLTTGAYLQMQHDVRLAGLAGRVVFVEATIDPWRDSPARLRAFARMTHAGFPMLTGTQAQIRRLWKFFGVGYRRVPQGHPPATDWMTGKPLTFDVQHTDGLFIIDAQGRERVVMLGMPSLDGHLGRPLRSLLNDSGLRDLKHPQGGWTVRQALANLSHLLGRRIPARPL